MLVIRLGQFSTRLWRHTYSILFEAGRNTWEFADLGSACRQFRCRSLPLRFIPFAGKTNYSPSPLPDGPGWQLLDFSGNIYELSFLFFKNSHTKCEKFAVSCMLSYSDVCEVSTILFYSVLASFQMWKL